MGEEKNIPKETPKEQSTNLSADRQDSSKKEDKTISQTESQALKIQSQTKDMEAHAHQLHKAPSNGWKHYLFEFLMLFLAVFCGFLAENWREHIIESNREKQYIKSFYEDLTADEHDLQLNINFLREQMLQADSLQQLMSNINIKQPANEIYMFLRGITRSTQGLLYPNDRTIVQLRNAGGMRLIKNKSVSDSMAGYYRTVETIRFLTEDNLITKRIQNLKEMAGRIKTFIKRKYHLKNE